MAHMTRTELVTHSDGSTTIQSADPNIDRTAKDGYVRATAFRAVPFDRPMPPHPDAVCEWFLYCERKATGYRNHSILGDVPICDHCNTRMELQQ